VKSELQKPGQKECEVTEKLYARGIDEWWPESTARRQEAWRQLTSRWKKMGRMWRKLRSSTSFIGAEEKGERTAVPRISDATLVANRSDGDASRRSGPCLDRLRALRSLFKPTRGTVRLGWAQSFTQKLFHLFILALTCKL
jgi:hypothetical protein